MEIKRTKVDTICDRKGLIDIITKDEAAMEAARLYDPAHWNGLTINTILRWNQVHVKKYNRAMNGDLQLIFEKEREHISEGDFKYIEILLSKLSTEYEKETDDRNIAYMLDNIREMFIKQAEAYAQQCLKNKNVEIAAEALNKIIAIKNGTSSNKVSDQDIYPSIAFPFEILPGEMNTIIKKISDAHQVEPEVVASEMLVILSGALGNSICIEAKEGHKVRPYIWSVIIKETGYGQSPLQDLLLKHVYKLQAEKYASYKEALNQYQVTMKKNKQTTAPPPKLTHYIVNDCTIEALADVFESSARGVHNHQDEISGFILGMNQYKGGHGNDKQKYLTIFNTGSLKIDRKSGSRLIQNTGMSMSGGIQPKALIRIIRQDSFDDGFISRFLPICAENRPPEYNLQSITEDNMTYWTRLLDWCYGRPLDMTDHGEVRPMILKLSIGALKVYKDFYDSYGARIPLLSERGRGFIPKLQGYYALKFAGILHMISKYDRDEGEKMGSIKVINEIKVVGAIKLIDFYAGQIFKMLRLYDEEIKVIKVINVYQKRLINVIHSLKDEVINGKLLLRMIVKGFNDDLPHKLHHSPERIKRLLNEIELDTRRSTDNLSVLIWDDEKIQKLFTTI